MRKVEKLYKLIGRVIRETRKVRGLSQDELAVRVGLSRPTIVSIERGHQRIALHTIPKFAKALRIQVSDLLPGGWV